MSFPQPAETPNWPLEAAREAAAGDAAKESAKRAFLRMVSHELRTPLNSIIGFSDILNQELYGPLGSPQYVEYAGIIRDSGKRLLSLFNNVLDIVRLEGGGGLAPMKEPVLPVIEEAVAKLRPQATAGGVTLYNRMTDEDLHAWLDPRGLVACLDHLLRNAIAFTAAGDTVEINAKRAKDHVVLTVFNRGNAPDQSEIERLMKPFEQGENAENRHHEGAGLGWAVCQAECRGYGRRFRRGVAQGRGSESDHSTEGGLTGRSFRIRLRRISSGDDRERFCKFHCPLMAVKPIPASRKILRAASTDSDMISLRI